MNRVVSLIALGACLAVCGCGSLGKPGGIAGTGLGDLEVSDTEAGWLDMLRPGGGKIAQQFMPPKKPAEAALAEAMAAQGFRQAASYDVTLIEGAAVAAGQRVIPGDQVERITVRPYWIAPKIEPKTIMPEQITGLPAVSPAQVADADVVQDDPPHPGAGDDSPIAQQIQDSLTPK